MSNEPFAVGTPGVTAESYWAPRHYVVSAWIEHAPFASWIMAAARPRVLVELGTHNGFSFFVFAEAAKRLGLDTTLVAVDSWEGDDQAGFYGDEVFEAVQAIAARDYPAITSLRRGFFNQVASSIEDGSVDLLHVDGRHGYEDVMEDYELYEPKLSKRGVVLFHDTREFQDGFGVHRFWDELAATRPSFTFEHGHGLGVLAHGSECPSPVLEFLERARREPDEVRRFYEERGRVITRNKVLEIDHFELIDGLRREKMRRDNEIAQLEHDVEALTMQYDALRSSTSWRATKPLRSIISLVRRSG